MTLRRVPEDFIVEELLRDDVTRSLAGDRARRPFAVYRVSKTSLTTEGAAARLAGSLGLRAGMVSYAGLKDKHASTTQYMTAGPLDTESTPPAEVAGDAWSAALAGWSREPAAAKWIRRNHFVITVRGLTHERAAALTAAANKLSLAATPDTPNRRLLFVNYFGDQRFGSARHGAGFVARHLVRGDFEQALRLAVATPARKDTGKRRALTRALSASWGRWDSALSHIPPCPERRVIELLAAGGDYRSAFAALPYFQQQMFVEAYQSYLWNEIARRVAAEIDPESPITAASPFGTAIHPTPARAGALMKSLEIPTLSPATRPVEPWRAPAEEVLRVEGITLEQLRIPGLRRPAFGEAWRPLFALAEHLAIHESEPDDLSPAAPALKRRIAFDLPRGAYATVLLRALGA